MAVDVSVWGEDGVVECSDVSTVDICVDYVVSSVETVVGCDWSSESVIWSVFDVDVTSDVSVGVDVDFVTEFPAACSSEYYGAEAEESDFGSASSDFETACGLLSFGSDELCWVIP